MGTLQAAATVVQGLGAVTTGELQEALCEAFEAALEGGYCEPGYKPANDEESFFNNHLYRELRNRPSTQGYAGAIVREYPALVGENLAGTVGTLSRQSNTLSALASHLVQNYVAESARLLGLAGLAVPGTGHAAILASDNISIRGCPAMRNFNHAIPSNTDLLHFDGYVPSRPPRMIEIKGPLDSVDPDQAATQRDFCKKSGAELIEVNCDSCGTEDSCARCRKKGRGHAKKGGWSTRDAVNPQVGLF